MPPELPVFQPFPAKPAGESQTVHPVRLSLCYLSHGTPVQSRGDTITESLSRCRGSIDVQPEHLFP